MTPPATTAGPTAGANIASALPAMAATQPDALAIACPAGREPDGRIRYGRLTYRELDAESDRLARGLTALGIGPGVRTVLMVTPSPELFALTFALFKAGAVLVLVDPGMGIRNLKQCLAQAAPAAFIGIPKAQVARLALGWARATCRTVVTVGRRWGWGGVTLAHVRRLGETAPPVPADVAHADAPAAILFTSGSTGVPKGALYHHAHFLAQVAMLRAAYDITPGEIDLPTFPLFALFDPALGMSTVIPQMDASRPAAVDPVRIIQAIRQCGVTNMFGSPALLNRVGRYGVAHGVTLPSLRRVISAGAPVPAAVLERFRRLLPPEATIHTPYGATEALPVATIESRPILASTAAATAAGAGVCVGRPVPPNVVEVIGIDDGPIERWHDALRVGAGTVGELVVRGPSVTPAYWGLPEQTALAKIAPAGDEGLRHRMGDVGYLDAEGRVWFCGRKAHRVTTPAGTLFSVACEGVFNAHPDVFRSALVGVVRDGVTMPVLCVEPEPGRRVDRAALSRALCERGAGVPLTAAIRKVLFPGPFPVDIRHNAKIDRAKLAAWAARALGGTPAVHGS